MSYILDALKKSQRQRELGRVPSLDADHAPTFPVEGPARFGWGVAAGSAAGVLAVAAAAVVLGWGPWAVPARQEPPARVPHAVAPEVRAPRLPPVTVPAPAPQVAAPVEIPAPVVVRPAPAALPASADLPTRDDLPAAIRASVPELRLNVHVYADGAAARFVFINNALYHEGQTTREGALVEAITPEGVVLSFGGTRFRAHL